MFNPKENNLLDEQLAVSGLEMNLFGVFAAVSAVSSIVGGISASNQAAKNNARAKANAAGQQAASEEAARMQNEYNKKVFAADKANYYLNRAYDWETTLKNYKYKQEIQEHEYQALAAQYSASVDNTQANLAYNSMAALQGEESAQATFTEILNEDAFQRESLLVEQLQEEGQAALMQAGKSRSKALQSRAAKTGRAFGTMDASLKSAAMQSNRDLRDISLQKFIDDQNVRAAMMLQPFRLPSLPPPVQGPERIFVEPLKATAAYIPAPLTQSTFAPIVQGVGSAMGSLASNKDLFS